jgi:hypothetical protein
MCLAHDSDRLLGAQMHEFTSIDHFPMPDRSIVYAFAKSQIPSGMTNLHELAGQVVSIDGKKFRVTTVDAHPVSENDQSTTPEDFGLMVTPAD